MKIYSNEYEFIQEIPCFVHFKIYHEQSHFSSSVIPISGRALVSAL